MTGGTYARLWGVGSTDRLSEQESVEFSADK